MAIDESAEARPGRHGAAALGAPVVPGVTLRGIGELAAFIWAALKATLDLFIGSRKPGG